MTPLPSKVAPVTQPLLSAPLTPKLLQPSASGWQRLTRALAEPRYRLLLVLSGCFACVALDSTKMVAALPTLARESSADPALLKWVVEASLLVYASLLLLGGSLAERFGARRLLLVGLVLFGLGSFGAALTNSPLMLLVWRAVVGVGAAGITPATLATLKHSFNEQERPRAIAIWTASFGVGATAGPVSAGVLLDLGGFSAVLLANVPFAALGFVGAYRLVSASLPRRNVPIDVTSTLLAFALGACLLFGLLDAPMRGWSAPAVLGAFAAAAVLGVVLVAWQGRAAYPLLDPALFRVRRFPFALLVILLGYFAFSGTAFVVAQYLQLARGFAAFQAGLLLMPLALSLLVGTLLAPAAMQRFGAERALLGSLVLAGLGALVLLAASRGPSDWVLVLGLIPFGAGAGGTFANATEMTLGSVSEERAGTAAAINESAFEFGGVLGIALLGTLLGSSTVASELTANAPRALWAGVLAVVAAFSVALMLSRSRPAAA
jgi:MFS family permease